MTDAEFRARLRTFGDLPCWKVGLAYGSTLFFELGERLREKDGGPDSDIGSMSLWLYSDDWRIEQSGVQLTDSDSVDRQKAEGELAVAFAGERLEALIAGGKSVEACFSRSIRITLWRPDESELDAGEDLVHCFLPDGQIACFNAKDQL